MGKPMSRNLLKAGHQLVVFDIDQEAVEERKQAGAEAGASPKDVATKANTIVTMLSNSPQAKVVVLGKDGVIEGAQRNSIVADMSSIAPLVVRKVSAALTQKDSYVGRAGERRPAKGHRWQPFYHGRWGAGRFLPEDMEVFSHAVAGSDRVDRLAGVCRTGHRPGRCLRGGSLKFIGSSTMASESGTSA